MKLSFTFRVSSCYTALVRCPRALWVATCAAPNFILQGGDSSRVSPGALKPGFASRRGKFGAFSGFALVYAHNHHSRDLAAP